MNQYSKLKKLIVKIFPKSFLFRYEHLFRNLYYKKYAGNKYKCNICDSGLRSFVEIKNDQLCPKCGSLQRTRRLWQILEGEFIKRDLTILDFSPSRNIYRLMKKKVSKYISSDLSGDFISDVAYNIKDINCNDETFDLIICYHILEHIDDDLKAMRELNRVLKKESYCIIQTPFKDGEIYENEAITSPQERGKHFGQSDHVRIYSINGLKNRLEEVGFRVEVRNYKEEVENYNGFGALETVLICQKQ
jgi:SAM-dependent methyltransferase